MSSNIVFQVEYKNCKNLKTGIKNWVWYATQKQKADSSSIDEKDYLKDFIIYKDKDNFLDETSETFLWNKDGDLLNDDVKIKIDNINRNGYFWRGFLSFPPDFASSHGLITKVDFYNLTNNIMPSLILDMGLDLNNTEWMCSLHRDTKHPHIHMCLFEIISTNPSPTVPKYAIHNFKSNVANYLIDNTKFYELRDQMFKNITSNIEINDYNKIKGQRLFSDAYRRKLNKLLLDFYNKLPKTGRLQYNSSNMKSYKGDLNRIIDFILMHDSVKYEYAKYIRLLEEHQRELNQIYGMSEDNKRRKYFNDQKEKLYSKIGNEILQNYKYYSTLEFFDKEKEFLKRHINEMDFKSKKDYKKNKTKEDIAKSLYKICMIANLNDIQTKKVFERWIYKSKYNYDAESLISSIKTDNIDITVNEYFKVLKKLGYSTDKYKRLKEKNFYRELNYKRFINEAIEHLMYELSVEEKQIINEMQYDLDGGDYNK